MNPFQILLDEKLDRRGKSARWLARQMGLSSAAVGHYFSDRGSLPGPEKVISLAVALDCSPVLIYGAIRERKRLRLEAGHQRRLQELS